MSGMYQHQCFVGGELYESCVKEASPGSVKAYKQQLFIFESHLDESEKIWQAARVILAEKDEVQIRRKQDIWNVPIGIPPVQPFSQNVFHFILLYHQDFLLYRTSHDILLHHWSAVRQTHTREVDV